MGTECTWLIIALVSMMLFIILPLVFGFLIAYLIRKKEMRDLDKSYSDQDE